MSIENIKQWDPQKFNKDFDNYIKEVNQKNKEEDEKLKKNNELIIDKNIFDYSIKDFIYEWKMSIINFINNIIHLKFNKETLTENNTLFFIGFTIIFSIILYIVLSYIYKSLKNDKKMDLIRPNDSITKVVYEFKE